MNKILMEKIRLIESFTIKAFDTDNNPITIEIELDDVLSFGGKIDKSYCISLYTDPDILVPLSTIELLRTQIPEKEV